MAAHWAAVLWAGPGCALSHAQRGRDLASPRSPPSAHRNSSCPRTRAPRVGGCRRAPGDAASAPTTSCRSRGLPVTSPVRTIIDLAGCSPNDDLEAALERARSRGLVTVRAVRRPSRRDRHRRPSRRGPAPDAPRGRSVPGGSTRPQEWRGDGRRASGTAGLRERGRGARAPARLQRRPHHAALRRAARGRPRRRAQRGQGTRRRARARRPHQRRRRRRRRSRRSTSWSRSSAGSSPRAV